MSAVLIAVWVVLGLFWVVSAPGFIVGFAALGDPPRGFLPGWGIAFLGWLTIPVAVVVAVVAIVRDGTGGLLAWLPIISVLVIPAGYLLAAASAAVVARVWPEGAGRGQPAYSQADPPPLPVDLSALDDAALIASQLALVSRVVDVWFPVDYTGIDPAFPRLVLDTVRHGLDGEPVRRALGDLSDFEMGKKILRPRGRQAAFGALVHFARMCAIGGPDQLPPRNDTAHEQLIRLAAYALQEIVRPLDD